MHLDVLGRAADPHSLPAEDVVRADEHRVADRLGDRTCLLDGVRRPPRRRVQAELCEDRAEARPILGRVDRAERVAEERRSGRGEGMREREAASGRRA